MAAAGAPPSGAAPPVFGRHAVVEGILHLLQEVREGEGKVVLLVGAGGVGKSTVLGAAAELAGSVGYAVISARARPADPPEPFGLVRSLLEAARATTRDREAEAPGPSASLPMFLAPFESDSTGAPARATGLVESSTETREADRLLDHLANPIERIDATRSSLLARFAEFFLQLARERPLLLALDDVHVADDSSLEFLKELLPSIGHAPLLVLASSLPLTEVPARSRGALEEIAGLAGTSTVRLLPMTETELGEFVRWLLRGRDPGRDAVMRWFTQTEGNPLFAEYLVRASAGLGRSTAGDGRPQDFAELLLARVRELPDSERRLLVYGSVIGNEFDFPTLASAAGQEEERLSEALDHLVHEGLLREKSGEVYEFVSERARADVYAQLTETRRRLLHRKVARALEGRPARSPTDTFELARQFYLARDDRRAMEYNRRAAELASKSFALDSAVLHLERALESLRRIAPRDVPLEIRLEIELGRYQDELGDLHRSEETLLDAVARSRAEPGLSTELAFALLGLAQTRSDLTQYAAARELALEAYGILDRANIPRGLLAAHRVLGVAGWRLGDLAEAERHQREELALAEAHGTPVEIGHALIDLANTFTLLSPARTEEALVLYERAAAILAESGDHSARARVLMNLALLLHYAGRPDDALGRMREAVEAAERSRSRIWIGYCSLNLSQFLAERHELAAARATLDRSEGLLGPLGDQLARQQITMIRGIIAAEDGAYAEAEAKFTEAMRLARELSLTAESAEMEFRFADLAAREGRPDVARDRITAARSAGIERLRADLLPRLEALARAVGPGDDPRR